MTSVHPAQRAERDIRKHVAWYFKGYPVGGDTRARLATVSSLDEIDELLARDDLTQEDKEAVLGGNALNFYRPGL